MTPRVTGSNPEVTRDEVSNMIAAQLSEYDRLTIEPRSLRMHEENKKELRRQGKEIEDVKEEVAQVKSDVRNLDTRFDNLERILKWILGIGVAIFLTTLPQTIDTLLWAFTHHFIYK